MSAYCVITPDGDRLDLRWFSRRAAAWRYAEGCFGSDYAELGRCRVATRRQWEAGR